MANAFLITCEHGGNRIPAAYQQLFRGQQSALNSHCGYDPGALVMAKSLSAVLDAPLVSSTISRLLIDLNRPAGHARLYSPVTRGLPARLRAEIASRYHQPYLAAVQRLILQLMERDRRVVHVASHSFTPELHGEERRADIGLLYDPERHGEAELCRRWQENLTTDAPQLRVRRNYPYRGKAAGLTAQLRRRFNPDAYVGIELEINQRIFFTGGRGWSQLRRVLPVALMAACIG